MLAQLQLIFLFSWFSTSEQCLKTLPPEEVYITSTEPLFETTTVNLCNDCEIDELVQNAVGTDYFIDIGDPELVDNCIELAMICNSTGSCKAVAFFAKSGGKTVQITSPWSSVGETFTCEKDGTFSLNDVKNIEEISCSCTD